MGQRILIMMECNFINRHVVEWGGVWIGADAPSCATTLPYAAHNRADDALRSCLPSLKFAVNDLNRHGGIRIVASAD